MIKDVNYNVDELLDKMGLEKRESKLD